jgi:hypothetical protein
MDGVSLWIRFIQLKMEKRGGFCLHPNRTSVFIESWKFLDKLSGYRFLNFLSVILSWIEVGNLDIMFVNIKK